MVETNPEELRQTIGRIMPLMTAADFCDRNARENGDKEALIDRRQRLTWSQVKISSDRLAIGLRRLGLERDACVLVQLPNQVELFLTRLACEKAGLRLITVAPTFRRAELEPILRLTQPAAAIIRQEYRGFDHFALIEQLREETLKHIVVIGDDVPKGTLPMSELLAGRVEEKKLQELRQSRYGILDVCQIATTSGSTGAPKCVAVPLYTRLLTGWIHLKRFGVKQSETLAAATSIITGTADALIYNGATAIGARIVLMDHFTAEVTCAAIEAEGVNILPLVPTMIVRLMNFSNLTNYDLRSLRAVVNHGATLAPASGKTFEELVGCRIVQALGSVDCGGIAATRWDDPSEVRLNTVGKPLDGNAIKLVDSAGQKVLAGLVGRLHVRGPHTDARFFMNPALDAIRGDDGYIDLQELALMDGDGNLILLGREKDLIIRGGQNIYPTDIEAALMQHPHIQDVSVAGIPDQELGERVWAFVVCGPKQSLTLEEIKTFLEEKGLARFKWPEGLTLVDSLPKVAAGQKVDRQKLKYMVQN